MSKSSRSTTLEVPVLLGLALRGMALQCWPHTIRDRSFLHMLSKIHISEDYVGIHSRCSEVLELVVLPEVGCCCHWR